MLGQGKLDWGPCTHGLTVYGRESKDKEQSSRCILAFWQLPCYYQPVFMPFTFTKLTLYILQSVRGQVCGGSVGRHQIQVWKSWTSGGNNNILGRNVNV